MQTTHPLLSDPRFLRELCDNIAYFIQARHTTREALEEQVSKDRKSDVLASEIPTIRLVEICGDCIVVDQRRLDLSRRPKLLALFRAFLETPGMFLSSEELLEILYGTSTRDGSSRRYLRSCHENILKLLSRARIAATREFGGANRLRVEWFAFNPTLKGWHLYRASSWNHPFQRLIRP